MRKGFLHITLVLPLLLAFPLFYKAAHALLSHHHLENTLNFEKTSNDFVWNVEEEHCSICDFEYTGFVNHYSVILVQSPLYYNNSILPFENNVITSYTGTIVPFRGPPQNVS
jgi:hypothetical protein